VKFLQCMIEVTTQRRPLGQLLIR